MESSMMGTQHNVLTSLDGGGVMEKGRVMTIVFKTRNVSILLPRTSLHCLPEAEVNLKEEKNVHVA